MRCINFLDRAQEEFMLTPDKIRELLQRISPVLESSGLEVPHIHFELVGKNSLSAIAAYSGMPTRFGHWSFGKAYHRMKTEHDYRLTQIYELVVNSQPAYAFLDRETSPAQALLILVHVAAHVDFFLHNRLFFATAHDMVAQSAWHQRQFESWRRSHGKEAVETLIDAAMILMDFTGESTLVAASRSRNDDLLGYVAVHAPSLEPWEREALMLLRAEARYFWPQQLTKISNEGYATFWHLRILRQMPLTAGEIWDVARLHTKVVQTTSPQLNPYRLGLAIYQDLERSQGLEAVWQARDQFDDAGLVRAGLHEDMTESAGLALFKSTGAEPEPHGAPFATMKTQLLCDLENAGIPHLTVNPDASRSDLVLVHHHNGRDLDFAILPYAMEVVAQRLWRGRVLLHTIQNRIARTVSHDGSRWTDSATG